MSATFTLCISTCVMEYTEAKQHFISTWGELGCNWGICRTMGHIHALLLVSPEVMCAESIMEDLQISRGNANMNLRALMDWGLVYRRSKPGERKDFYEAEKDFWNVFRKTLKKRKEKELAPMLKMIKSISNVNPACAHSKEFTNVISELNAISNAADKSLDKMLNSESNLLLNAFVKVMR